MKQPTRSPAELLAPGRALTFANVAEGAEGLVVSDLARAVAARPKPPAVSLAVVCRDGPRMQQLARALEFFAPDLPVMQFPAWDCQPYDRVSPHGGILAQRLTTPARLSRLGGSDKPLNVLATGHYIVARGSGRPHSPQPRRCRSHPATSCRWTPFGRGCTILVMAALRLWAGPANIPC